jgi:hypothetical protein
MSQTQQRVFGFRTALLRAALALGCSVLVPSWCSAITFGQVDDFQNGTTMGWQEGMNSPNPPVNVASGGPGGTADRYLENQSSGGFGAGGRMAMFNSSQWSGNYIAAGVNRISVQMANLGSKELHMRIAFRSASGTLYGSSSAAILPVEPGWRSVNFDLTPEALTNMGGSDTVAQALTSVTEFRIVSAVGAPAFSGDPIAGTLGLDNMNATTIPVPAPVITEFGFVNDSLQLSFVTMAGKTYRVERKDSLADSEWVALSNATSVSGTGNVVHVSDPQPGVRSLRQRFYRVVLLES